MLKFLKMMVAEDVITMEEVQVEVLVVQEVLLQEEKVVLLQEEKVLQVVDLEVIEAQLQEKVVSDQEVHLLLEEKVALHRTDLERKVLLIELQDVLKDLVIHQDQEDQEETNMHC